MRLQALQQAELKALLKDKDSSAPTTTAAPTALEVGQGKVEPKLSVKLGSEEEAPLAARFALSVPNTALELELAAAGPLPSSQELGKLRARLKACLADLKLMLPGQLDPKALERLASAADNLGARHLANDPLLAEVAAAARAKELSSGLRRSGSSVVELHRMWQEAYRQDPAGTSAQVCEAFQLSSSPEELRPVLAKLLGHSSCPRAFVKTTRAWMRATSAEARVAVRSPAQVGPITAAENVPTMTRSPDGKVRNMVIVGQGPIGLLTAVLTKAEAGNSGTQIYLVDKRGAEGSMEYTRPIKLAVRHAFLSLLDAARDPKGGPSALELLKQRGQVHFLESSGPKPGQNHGEISRKRAVRQPLGIIAETSVALVETRHLEQALRDIAGTLPGVHFLNGYEPALHADGTTGLDGQPTFGLSLQKAGKDAAGHWAKIGGPVDLGTPDLIVAADGASSHTVKDAGIGLRVGQPLGRYVAGTVTVPSGPNVHNTYTIPRTEGEAVKVYANTVGGIHESWMIAQIPPDWTEAEATDANKVRAYYRWVCSQALGQDLNDLQVTWGGSSSFTLRPSMTTEPGRGNVIPVGDATGNNTFLVGAGTVGGAQEAYIVAQMIERMNGAGSLGDAEKAFRIGARDTYRAAAAWHQRGPASAKQELSIRELLRDNVTAPSATGGAGWMASV